MRGEAIGCKPLLDNPIAVDRGVDIVAGAVKDDDGDDACMATHSLIGQLSLLYRVWTAFACALHTCGLIGSGSIGEARMHSDGSKDIRIGGS